MAMLNVDRNTGADFRIVRFLTISPPDHMTLRSNIEQIISDAICTSRLSTRDEIAETQSDRRKLDDDMSAVNVTNLCGFHHGVVQGAFLTKCLHTNADLC